jgi:enoyl-CoA hydratase
MARQLVELAERVEDDRSAQLLAITGAEGYFCSGFEADVEPNVIESLAALSKPTVAIINGEALDEGVELAAALDIRVAWRGARLAVTQLGRGKLPHFGATQRLPRLIGPAAALRMILTGAPLTAPQAFHLGLVSYLARDQAELARTVRELCRTLLSRGPLALRLAKEAIHKGFDLTLTQGISLEEDLYALLQTTADRAEGIRAFLEKRKPRFKGS